MGNQRNNLTLPDINYSGEKEEVIEYCILTTV